MFKKSILSLFMIFGIGFSLIGAEKSAETVRINSLNADLANNNHLNNRDQWIKFGTILLPTAIVGAVILKSFSRNGMSVNEGCLSLVAGGMACIFFVITNGLLSSTQKQRAEMNGTLRKELSELSKSQ